MTGTVILKRVRMRPTEPAPVMVVPEPTEQLPIFWTEAELCAALQVSDWVIAQWRRDGLPCMVRGRIVRFVPADVLRWVQSQYETPAVMRRVS